MRIPRWLPTRQWAFAIPILLGLAAGLWVSGGTMLWPGQTGWLVHGDLAQSYLGWASYRHAPWSWPPGANPAYGAGLHSSVYYSDSIPLLALLFKLLSTWLPEPFQYFGLWVLACFVLQAVFAWCLLGLADARPLERTLGTVFFVLAPPMLNRLGGHMALVGHWMVLMALWLCLSPVRRRQATWWACLMAMAMIVHAYLFAMVAAIWVADMARRRVELQHAAPLPAGGVLRCWLPELALVAAAALAAAWLAGFFMVSGQGMQAEGFGYYKMNLLAPFNGDGWSRFGLHFAQAPGEYEGFNYLGLGSIVLIALALYVAVARRGHPSQRLIPWSLWIVATLLVVLAVTCNIGFGAWQWHMPLPERLWTRLSHLSLQSTGRLAWVAYYLVLLAALFAVLQRLRERIRVVLLLVLVVVQLVDLYPGLSGLRATLLARTRGTPAVLNGPFWDAAGQRYGTLRQLPLALMSPGWERLAFYAQAYRMRTDAVQLARIDWPNYLALYNQGHAALLGDRLDPSTLYLLDARELEVARVAIPEGSAALFQLDGLDVLAPGWSSALPADAVSLRKADTASSPFRLPFQADMAQMGAGRLLLGEGWDSVGDGEVSSRSNAADVFVPVGGTSGQAVRVTLDLRQNDSTAAHAQQHVDVLSDGRRIGTCSFADGSCRSLVLELPVKDAGLHFRQLQLRSTQPGIKLRVVLEHIRVEQAG